VVIQCAYSQPLATSDLFCITIIFVILRMSHEWNPMVCNLLKLVSVCQHNAFEIHPSLCVHWEFIVILSSLLLLLVSASIHWYGLTPVSLSILLLKDLLGCFQFGMIMNGANMYRFFCEYKLSFLLAECLGVELWSHMLSICLIL
jgi:hypothetical protein